MTFHILKEVANVPGIAADSLICVPLTNELGPSPRGGLFGFHHLVFLFSLIRSEKLFSQVFEPPKSNSSRDFNFYLVIFGPMNYYLVTDRRTDGRTDRWTDRRKVTHKSPQCMSTGGLKMNHFAYFE